MTPHPADRMVLHLDWGHMPFYHEYKEEEKHQTIPDWISGPRVWRLQVAQYLEGLPSHTARWSDRVSPRWRTEDLECLPGTVVRYVATEGYVQVYLLSSPLFHDVPEEHIRDIRPHAAHGRRHYLCRDCRQLSEALVKALVTYDAHYQPQVFRSSVRDSLKSLHPFIEGVIALHRQRLLSNKDLQAIRLQRIVDAYTLLQRVAQGMSPTDYARMSTGVEAPSSAYATLLQQMDEAFLAHGPVRYPADAVDYAKALILSSLGIEPNTELKTIVNRYRQNRRRAGTSLPPFTKRSERPHALSPDLGHALDAILLTFFVTNPLENPRLWGICHKL
jgi:hypothetical protein